MPAIPRMSVLWRGPLDPLRARDGSLTSRRAAKCSRPWGARPLVDLTAALVLFALAGGAKLTGASAPVAASELSKSLWAFLPRIQGCRGLTAPLLSIR